MKNVLFITGNRDGYHPDQCAKTMTVGELITYLQELIDDCCLDESDQVFLRNDNGYTYGSISQYDLRPGCYDDETVDVSEF